MPPGNTAMTPQEILQQIRELTEQLSQLNGNAAPDTKEPLIYGNNITDVRLVNGLVQLSLGSEIGWVIAVLEPAAASYLASAIAGAVGQVLVTTQAQTELQLGELPVH